jgi:flagellar biosynthesis anti-sigma factor FlgM
MRITSDEATRATQIGHVKEVSGRAVPVEGASSTHTAPAATVTLSPQAQEINHVKAAVSQLPDVRADLVASLKAQVESGTYRVSSEDIADMIMRRSDADIVR